MTIRACEPQWQRLSDLFNEYWFIVCGSKRSIVVQPSRTDQIVEEIGSIEEALLLLDPNATVAAFERLEKRWHSHWRNPAIRKWQGFPGS